jgi:type II secretory pathway pseudopilin PulG
MNFKKNLLSNYWFTIPELVVSVVISTIVVLWLMTFLSNVQWAIAESARKSAIFTELWDFLTETRDLRTKHPKTVLYDIVGWFDSVLVTSLDSNAGYVIGVVDFSAQNADGSFRFDTALNAATYTNKVLAIAPVSSIQIASIISSTGATITNVPVYTDSVYPNLHISDFQVRLYNSGTLVDAFIRFRNNYLPSFTWRPMAEVPNVTPLDYAINF